MHLFLPSPESVILPIQHDPAEPVTLAVESWTQKQVSLETGVRADCLVSSVG